MITIQKPFVQIASQPVSFGIQGFVERMNALWWECETSLPELGPTFSNAQQRANEQRLARLFDGLIAGLKRLPQDGAQQAAMRTQILDEGFAFAQSTFGFKEDQMNIIRQSGMIEVIEQFAREARCYDPGISGEDIYQASRNVMTMSFIQILLGLPVEMTPAVFAYSMLYPYTDNYLDDPRIALETKMGFNRRFWQRLAGDSIPATNAQEERIWDLVDRVEGQYQRARYPQVYESLLAIHEAQSRSLRQLRSSASPYEVDVLSISFAKGGTSVLADGYLVAGNLSEEQASFLFGYGAFTQLMDDLEDVEADRKAGFMTIFSQTAGRWPLDGVTNRVFHLGRVLFSKIGQFPVPEAAALQEMILQALDPLLSSSAASLERYYSAGYLRTLETHMPFRFKALREQNKKLERSKVSLMKLVER